MTATTSTPAGPALNGPAGATAEAATSEGLAAASAPTTSARQVARPAPEVRAEEGEAGARTSTSHPLVVGVDLSLIATGVAHHTPTGHVEDVITATGRGIVRLRQITAQVKALTSSATLVVLEGPAYAARHGQTGHHERAGLYWLLQDRLLVAGRPVAVIPPASLKLYALGRGGGKGTDKAAMVVAARDRLGYTGTENNEADALWLAAAGLAWLTGQHPVPKAHHRALDGCQWPA